MRQFPLLKIIRYVRSVFSFSVFFAVVSFLQLMASDSRSRARLAMECGPLRKREKERESERGGEETTRARREMSVLIS